MNTRRPPDGKGRRGSSGAHLLRFGDHEVDLDALELRTAGVGADLAPMAVRILVLLAQRSGKLVSREEIYEALWADSLVDRERLLNTYIRQIRAALGERAGDDRFIRTYPGRGYRFLPVVHHGEVGAARGRAVATWLVAAAAAAAAAIVALVLLRAPAADAIASSEAELAVRMGEEFLVLPDPQLRRGGVEHFRRAIRLAPASATAHAGLAETLFWAGELDEALASADRALEWAPRHPRALMVRGVVALQRDWAWTRGLESLKEAADADPDDADIQSALAFGRIVGGDGPGAREALDRALALEPTDPRVTGDLGIMYGWLGEHERALELCERALAVAPDAAWAIECAVDAALLLGDHGPASQHADALVRSMGESPGDVLPPAADLEQLRHALRSFQLTHAVGPGHGYARALHLTDLDRPEDALTELATVVSERQPSALMIGVEPRLEPLRDRPAFVRLLEAVRGAGA